MLGRAIAISMVGAIVLLAVLLQTTTPATIGPLGILFVFILLYVSVLGVLTFLLFWLQSYYCQIGFVDYCKKINDTAFNSRKSLLLFICSCAGARVVHRHAVSW